MNYQDSSYKQVRRPKGGGTREIVVKKEDTVSNVLNIGRKLFFLMVNQQKGMLTNSTLRSVSLALKNHSKKIRQLAACTRQHITDFLDCMCTQD